MSKELETIELIRGRLSCWINQDETAEDDVDEYLTEIETGLKRLEELEEVNAINSELYTKLNVEKEKQDKILKIIKEKKVAVDELLRCIENEEIALEEYNDFAGDKNSLSEIEFDLLKEWLELL